MEKGVSTSVSPTFNPTVGPTVIEENRLEAPEQEDMELEDAQKAEEKEEKADKNNDDDDEETDSPSFSPTTEPTAQPTSESPTSPPSVIIMGAIGDETAPPTNAATGELREEVTEAPTRTVVQTITPTLQPTVATTVEEPTQSFPELSVTVTATPTTGNVTEMSPYGIRLEPLYMLVTMEGIASEEGFMDVLVEYMRHNMERDFEGFDSISYGVTTFSMITKFPAISRSFNGSSTPTSNVTVHIHLLTATFESKPSEPDLVITEYMEMLLENEEMMQEYLDTKPNLDVTILEVSLEFEDTVAPTNVHGSSANGAEGQPSFEKKPSNAMAILGWTLGAFGVLLWMVFLYGVQSRPVS